MKTRLILFSFLMVIVASCAPAMTIASTTPPTKTATPMPTPTDMAIPLTLTPAEIPAPTLDLPSDVATPLPTQPDVPDYVLTPDATQVEHWKEYQTELIKAVLSGYSPAEYSSSLCEWDILGRSGQDVYVWAYCAFIDGGSGSTPAIIHLDASGSIQNVKTPRFGDAFTSDIQRMFPADVREKFIYYSPPSPYMGRPEVLRLHLHYRQEHPEELPSIILSVPPAS